MSNPETINLAESTFLENDPSEYRRKRVIEMEEAISQLTFEFQGLQIDPVWVEKFTKPLTQNLAWLKEDLHGRYDEFNFKRTKVLVTELESVLLQFSNFLQQSLPARRDEIIQVLINKLRKFTYSFHDPNKPPTFNLEAPPILGLDEFKKSIGMPGTQELTRRIKSVKSTLYSVMPGYDPASSAKNLDSGSEAGMTHVDSV